MTNQPKDDEDPPIIIIIGPKVKAFALATVKSPAFYVGLVLGAIVGALVF